MKRTNWLLIAAVLLLTALPLWLVPRPAPGPGGPPPLNGDPGERRVGEKGRSRWSPDH